MRRIVALALALLGPALAQAAPKAVIEVDPEDWYFRKVATKSIREGLSLTRGYAPFPVFFEGWKSEPWGDATEYEWDFGDGSPKGRSFCAARVYEKPGKYTVTLTVKDGKGGSATEKTTIEVLEPDGETYYVDSQGGDDANGGKSRDKAWKTATQAFLGIGERRYGPGDRILFRRGQTFDIDGGRVKPGHGSYRYGYSFGTFGEGERPVIRHTNGTKGELLKFYGVDACHIGFQDLVFECSSPDGATHDSAFNCMGRAANLLFLRCSFRGGYHHVAFNGPTEDAKGVISGVFIVDCDGKGSQNASIYTKCKRLAMTGCTWEDAGNHIFYGSFLQGALFQNNRFLRPSFGRAGLRISCASGSYEMPSEYVVVADNLFEGFVDPVKRQGGNGKRWNYTLCTISPNKGGPQLMQHIRWERNTVKGFERALQVGACEDVLIRDNRFETQDDSAASPRIMFGSEFEDRPIRDVRFVNNTIVSDETRSSGGLKGAVLALMNFHGKTPGRHEGLVFRGNRIEMQNGLGTAWWYEGDDKTKTAVIKAEGNTYVGINRAKDVVVQYGGGYKTPGRGLTLDEWYEQTGNEPPR